MFFRKISSKGLTVSAAESCTGGLIGYILTERPGSSSYFLGTAVTYSNEAKEKILGVSHETLMKFGAVSKETAKEMAIGSRNLYGSDLAVSVTGIAGPGGATESKPVGLVYIAVTDGCETAVKKNIFSGDRETVRKSAAETAIDMLTEMSER